MGGDGGNDCGALRAAHAGVSLSDAEASIVSPFNAKSKKISAIPELLKEGRGSLVTSLAVYKLNVIYGLLVSAARLALMWLIGGCMSEFDYLTIDCLVLMAFAQSMTLARPKKRLSSRSPTSSLLGPSTIISVVSTFVVDLFFLAVLFLGLRNWAGYPSSADWNAQFPMQQWWERADNYEVESVFIWVASQFVNSGLIFTFGGIFRRNAFRNISFSLSWVIINFLLFYLALGGPSRFHCLFRVNCDDWNSQQLASPFVKLFTFYGDGGPFNGEFGSNIMSSEWKFALIGICVANSLVNILFHKLVIDGFPAEYYRSKYPRRGGGKLLPV